MDTLVLVSTTEVLALRQAKHMMEALASRKFGANRVRLVINRMPSRTQIPVTELEKVMGQPIYAVIPSDSKYLNEAYSEPRLLDRSSKLGLEIGKLATRLTGIDSSQKKPRRIFSAWRKQK